MSSIQVALDIKEIKNIEIELKRLAQLSKSLRNKKKELEERILTFLNDTNHEAIKCDQLIAVNKEKKCRERKKKDEKDRDILEILQQAGVSRPEEILYEIKDSIKGTAKKVQTLKVINESNIN